MAWSVLSAGMITVAIPHWQGRVSPVFDTAGAVLVLQLDGDRVQSRRELALTDGTLQERAHVLAWVGVNVLICGAISRPLEMAVGAAGIRVIPQTCGAIEQVVDAYRQGRLVRDAFLMPGCCGRRRSGN